MDKNRLDRLRQWWKSISAVSERQCRVCKAAIEAHHFVCDADSCQMQALAEQAMVGGLPEGSPAHRCSPARRMRFHTAPAGNYLGVRLNS